MRFRIRLNLLLLAAVVAFVAPSVWAQARQDPYVRYPAPSKSPAAIKSLVGEVVNQQGGKLAQAVVHLKDKQTLEVKTRIADGQGKYVFRGLDRDADYEVHAEYQGALSPSKTVSHFDDKDEIYLVLEVPSK
jgi:carboxypeptidase family protein